MSIADWPFSPTAAARPVTPANRFGVDYREVARRLGPPPTPIIDAHLHVNGPGAVKVFKDVAPLFGITRLYSQTRLVDAEVVRSTLGDMVRFVSIPNFGSADRAKAFGPGYLDDIRTYRRDFGCRIVKFWNAPRLRDLIPGPEATDIIDFDAPWRVKAAEVASELGMMFQCHVADPDTWFATKYADAKKYGTKLQAYASLERMLDRFSAPWIAAHSGGWPEDLAFLSGLLERHANLVLDMSATKWIVREISKHPRDAIVAFLTKWKGRILFGSDIVTTDEHLTPAAGKAHPMGELADSPEAAFDLYASRYAALRAMWETGYTGESPIADPDLMMVEPGKYNPMSAPALQGFKLPRELLVSLYSGAAESVIGGWERAHP